MPPSPLVAAIPTSVVKRRPPPARLPPLFTAEISPAGLRHRPNGLTMTRYGRSVHRGPVNCCLDVSTITDSNVINIPVPTGTWSTPRCEYASVCCAKPPNLAFRNRVQYTVLRRPLPPPLHLEPTDSTPLLVADLLVPDAVVMPVRGPPAPRSYAGRRETGHQMVGKASSPATSLVCRSTLHYLAKEISPTLVVVVRAHPHSRGGSRSLLTPSKVEEISGRVFDRRTRTLQQSYHALIESHPASRRQDVEAIRNEVGWSGAFSEGTWEPIDTGEPADDNTEDDWFDDPEGGYESISVAILRRIGFKALSQSWTERFTREEYSWGQTRDQVYEAYLEYNRTGAPLSDPASPTSPAASSKSRSFAILCINFTTKVWTTFTSDASTPRVVTLARHGYFAPTPSLPSCAIHVDLLRFCVALRRHASTISIQGIATAICDMHRTIYTPHIRKQLSAAIDYYLIIHWMAEANLDKALSRDHPDWRMANTCPACSYRLKNEPKLKFSVLCTCDGNDSIKRVAASCTVDCRKFDHSYFLDSQYVDRFENEVPRVDEGADGLESTSTACHERWKNARADDNKKSIVVFDETGIFVASCRHGFVLLVEDMRQSGELAKYALAAVDRLCQVFGDDLLIGYDIGCTFRGTAERSPLVGPVVRRHNTNFVVGSFHGYAHNRKCQLANHPLNVEGAGLESFEENEQLFSSSNSVARTTRHASSYHRRQLLALHLEGWDFGRRCAIGSVLKGRYTSALRIMSTLPKELLKLGRGKSDNDWRAMFESEKQHFEALKDPTPKSLFAMHYVKRLRVLAEKKKAFTDAFSTNMAHTLASHIDIYRKHPSIQNTEQEDEYQHGIATQVRKIEAQRMAASEQLLVIQTEVERLEQEHAINPRWTPGCKEWEAAVEREALEDYHEALRMLELLVIQRIAELEKANAIGTGNVGYKARVQMSKAIKRREKALNTALNQYNAAAQAVNPPRPIISFNELSEYAYLANFDFLKYSEHGTLEAEWSRPVNRRCVELWQRIQRAEEEIIRLNIEITRVLTHIRDEEAFLSAQCEVLKLSNPNLAHILCDRLQLTQQVNQRVKKDLEDLAKLKKFSGSLSLGVGVHCTDSTKAGDPQPNNTPETTLEPNLALGDTEDAGLVDDSLMDDEFPEAAHDALTAFETCCQSQ
ncbi:hypothetical protein RhiXN_11148 [Rhizoctonia solani]|uniref:Uncharacterized protein n=1 Tax=Rhizoctonia solani TaxID=456999 RepID=A0A8H8P5L9_9AGAM|nr:uncharacterized protein RhiXN_11148 [Rhizoctonia solani]QRW26071.1 hypothetical protein RhiXN_11148 [Rhizoctonia solani]